MVSVLIATPVYDKKDYCLEKHLEFIRNIDYDNYHHIMVDNTDDGGIYTKRLKKLGVEAYHVERGGNSRNAICNAMNFVRDYFLRGKYDYLLVVESDLFPDQQVINRLLQHQVPVVGSFYLLGFEEHDKKMLKAQEQLRYGEINSQEFYEAVKGLQLRRACIFYLDKKATGFMGTRNVTPLESNQLLYTGLQRVHGVGLGCTLIRRDVITRFPFWADARFDNKHHDVYFYLDLHNAGIPVFCDTSIIIPHQPSDWKKVEDM